MADQQSEPKKYRFTPKPIDVSELPEPLEWAVAGLIPFYGITCWWGKPGAFKTFLAIAVAICKAAGLEFCGRWVGPPCKVLLIMADNPEGTKLRVRACMEAYRDVLMQHGIEPNVPNLTVLDIPINLHKPEKDVDAAIKEFKEQNIGAELLVVDTLFHSSIGAKLTLPEQMLPLLIELRRLMEAVGARACLLIHHPTKDGEEFFGSDTLRASVETLIQAEFEDATTAKITCGRMREDAFFDAFLIKLKKQTIKTKPDRRGRNQFTTLVVDVGAAAQPAKTLDWGLQTMLDLLTGLLGNKATRTEWMTEIQRRFTGANGKLRRGWSDDSIDRKIGQLEALGLIKGGRGRGEYYSVVEQVKAAEPSGIQPEAGGASEASTPAKAEEVVLTHPNPHSLLGNAGNAGKFLDPHKPASHPQTANAGDSNKSSNGSDPVVPPAANEDGFDLLKAAKEQLKVGKQSAA